MLEIISLNVGGWLYYIHMKTNEEIIQYLTEDINEMLPQLEELDINDSFSDYLSGVIERSQSVLRMMGVPEDKIPSNGDC
jgi:phosphoribosylformylglycinamidine (FGAM) synthase-like amidotransferase family enzyme